MNYMHLLQLFLDDFKSVLILISTKERKLYCVSLTGCNNISADNNVKEKKTQHIPWIFMYNTMHINTEYSYFYLYNYVYNSVQKK